jgi:ABC-type branched-subunit amino acid transport system substrate-binding protein
VGSKVHSPFAKHLFDALNKGADLDNDGIITANDLFNFVRKAVAVETEEYKAQTPGICPLKRHKNGEYLFLLQSEPNLEDAPPLRLKDSPYRGLKSYEEEHQDLYFGRKEQIEQLYEKVNNSNHRALTVVLGASGTGKSSLVKAGLIPFIKKQKLETNSSLETWQILKPIRLGESPLTALKNSLSQELNFIDYHSDSEQPQADEPKGFSKSISWFEIRRESNRAKQNQPLEKQVEFLSQNLKNWFDKNSGSTLMLTIDQFEELITLQPRQEQKEQNKKQKQKKKREEKQREKMQQELVLKWLPQVMSQYGERLRIVLTLRSDFESQFQDTDLKDYWKEEARFHIKEMTTAELREAITEPASKRSIFFVPDKLIDKLVYEVAGMPGTLPLLSFTLNELYRLFIEDINDGDKDDRAITEDYYNKLGGVGRSLTQKAEEEYDNLVNQDKAYEQTIRRVMLRMVAVGGSELARRRVLKSELEYPEPENTRVLKVVKTFVDARLLVEGDNAEKKPYVEPAHDALVRGWERLLKWKQEEEENLILQRQLTPAAVEWKIERSQAKGYLWHNNPRLDLLKKELKSNDKWFNKLETEFVQLSIARKTLLARRFTIGAVMVIVLLSAGLIASLMGQRNARIGQIRASQQASEANFISNQQLNALLNSLQAAKTLKDWPWYLSWFKPEHQIPFLFESDNELQPQVVKTLQKIVYEIKERNRIQLDNETVKGIFFQKDNTPLILSEKAGKLSLYNFLDKQQKKFAKDRNCNYTILDWNGKPLAATGEMIQEQSTDASKFKSFDCRKTAVADNYFINTVNHVGKKVEIEHKLFFVNDIIFKPDGKQMLTIHGEGVSVAHLWDLSKTKLKLELNKDSRNIPGEVTSASFSYNPAQNLLATGEEEGFIRIFNLNKTGENNSEELMQELEIKGHQGRIMNILFSSDNQQLITVGGEDRMIRLWDWKVKSLKKLRQLPKPMKSISFSPKNAQFVTLGTNGIVSLWDLQGNLLKELRQIPKQTNRIGFTPNGDRLVTLGEDQIVRLWDLRGKLLRQFEPIPQGIRNSHFNYVNDRLAIIEQKNGESSLVRLLNLDKNKWDPSLEISESISDGNDTLDIFFDRNTQLIAKRFAENPERGSDLESISIFKFVKKNQKQTLANFKVRTSLEGIIIVRFSLDGSLLAAAEANGTVHLWDWKAQKLLSTFKAHQGHVKNISFSNDNSLLATAGEDGIAKLWQIGTLNQLIVKGCDWIHDYLNHNPDVQQSDRHVCHGISESEKPVEISIGDKILVPTLTNPDKQAGVEAIAAGDFEEAITSLTAYLDPKKNPNDPEARIYLNNARIGNQKSYTIAVSVPISDINGSLEILRGVAQAQDDFNNWAKTQQSIIPIRVLIADDRNDRKIAQEIATQLANNPEVLGVVGHFSSSVTREAAQVYNDKNLVAISPVSTSVQLSDLLGKYVFRTVPNDKVAAEKLADYTLNSLKKQKAILFYNSQSEYSCSLASEFTTAFYGGKREQLNRPCSKYGTTSATSAEKRQGQILKEIDLSAADFDAAKSLKGLDPNTVLVLLADTSQLNQSFEILKANKGNLPILAGDDVYGSKILEFFAKEKLNNKKDMVVAIPWHIKNNRELGFWTTSKGLWGDRDVNWRTVTAYDAAKALIAAIKQNPNREAVAKILRSDSFTADGAIEKVQFLPSGDRDGNLMELVKIVKPISKSRSGYDYEFVPVENQTRSN